MADTRDHTFEICKLLKFSPRRDAIFDKLKQEIMPNVPGLCTLCPTHWTVHAASLESICLSYPTLMATWEEALDVAIQSELKARINGVAARMSDFDFLFCLMLAELLLRHSDNLSRTIQCSSMPDIEAHSLSELCLKVFQKMRNDCDFDLFWQLVQRTKEEI